ncbi:MAG: FAD-dependent oxidoreductase [Gemmatimonadaceae bacterium]
MSELAPHDARAEGRAHFAGEHVSVWPEWMHGALASGVRAAAEIAGPVSGGG